MPDAAAFLGLWGDVKGLGECVDELKEMLVCHGLGDSDRLMPCIDEIQRLLEVLASMAQRGLM